MRSRAQAMSDKISNATPAKASDSPGQAKQTADQGGRPMGKMPGPVGAPGNQKPTDDMSMLRVAAMGASGKRKAEYEKAMNHRRKS